MNTVSVMRVSLWAIAATFVGCASKELVVKSHPADANVYIKGFDREYFPEDKVKVGTTPLKVKDFTWVTKDGRKKTVSFNDVTSKEFYVIVEKTDFETSSAEAPPLYHDFKLPAIARAPAFAEDKLYAKVRISSTPEGAKVYVDGDLQGNTPFELTRKPGKYQVKLSLANHQEVNETLVLNANDARAISFPLVSTVAAAKPEAKVSSIKLTSTPSGSEVFVNGELVGNTPYELVRAPASYKVRVQHADYEAKEETMSVVEGEQKPIHIQLEKSAAEVAAVGKTPQ